MARLTQQDWLDHGLQSLADHGFTSLKADVLAQSLGMSRGSFYHHFADLSTFHAAVLEHWLTVSSLAVVTELEERDLDPESKIRALIGLVASGGSRLEQAVRAWAFSDAAVAATVAEVDRARLLYIEQVLGELDLDDGTASRRALILYLTNVGYSFLTTVMSLDEEAQAMADIAAYATER